jgi:large conductance mechanosensitive channel
MALGRVDFSQLFIALDGNDYATLAEAQEAAAPVVTYGAFIQTILDFVLIAFVIFLVVRAYNRMHRKEEAAPAPPPEEVLLLREIRDELRKPR